MDGGCRSVRRSDIYLDESGLATPWRRHFVCHSENRLVRLPPLWSRPLACEVQNLPVIIATAMRLFIFLLLSFPVFSFGQVDLRPVGNDHVSVTIDGQPFSDFYIGPQYSKPFLAPLRAPDGTIVTRRFPMETIPGESRDHPHHRGLWIGYGDVDGVNFWETEAESNTSKGNPSVKGKVILRKVAMEPGKASGRILATFAWEAPGRGEVLEEHRNILSMPPVMFAASMLKPYSRRIRMLTSAIPRRASSPFALPTAWPGKTAALSGIPRESRQKRMSGENVPIGSITREPSMVTGLGSPSMTIPATTTIRRGGTFAITVSLR
jgi:hypothetical protein